MNEISERRWLVRIFMELILKQSWSFEPNGIIPSRLQRMPTLQGRSMIVLIECREVL